jgi:hypothetical protein
MTHAFFLFVGLALGFAVAALMYGGFIDERDNHRDYLLEQWRRWLERERRLAK